MRSGKVYEKVARRHRKCLRQLYDIFQCNISLAALHTSHIIAMQAGSLGQFLLRIAAFVAELPQPGAKSRLNGAWGHTPMLEARPR